MIHLYSGLRLCSFIPSPLFPEISADILPLFSLKRKLDIVYACIIETLCVMGWDIRIP